MATPSPSPSPSPSFFSSIDSYFSTVYSLYKSVQEKGVVTAIMEGLADPILDSNQPFLIKAFACPLSPGKCAINVGKYLSYEGPRDAGIWSYWVAKTTFNVASYYLPKPPAVVSSIFRYTVGQVKEVAHYPTSWITGKTIEELKKIYLEEARNAGTKLAKPLYFRAVHLIVPLFVNCLCTQKAYENLGNTLHYAKLLLTGERESAVAYMAPTNSRMVRGNGKIVDVSKSFDEFETHSTTGLLRDTVLGALFTGLWSAGSYYTGRGIYEALKEAAKDIPNVDSRVKLIMGALAVGYIALPAILSEFGKWLNSAPSHKTYGTSEKAEHLGYTTPPSNGNKLYNYDSTNSYQNIDIDKLPPEELLNLLSTYKTQDPNVITKRFHE